MDEEIEERMKRFEERYRKEREIRCPFCDELQENDDMEYPVTYWGEPAISEFQCQECEKSFFVEEFVSRTYETGKTKEDLNYTNRV